MMNFTGDTILNDFSAEFFLDLFHKLSQRHGLNIEKDNKILEI